MRPDNPRPKAAGLSRARTFLQRDLAWLQGFPEDDGGLGWLVLQPHREPVRHELTRKHLQRATRTVEKLVNDFPHALPALVGDVSRWARTKRALLDALKPSIHGTAALPPEPLQLHPYPGALLQKSRRLAQAHPQLADVIAALQWIYWSSPKDLKRALAWLKDQRDLVEPILAHHGQGVRVVVRLWQLFQTHGEGRLALLNKLFALPGLWDMPLECSEEELERCAAPGATSEHKLAPLAPQLCEWVLQLGGSAEAAQKKSLELCRLAFLDLANPSTVARWRHFWDGVRTAQLKLELLRHDGSDESTVTRASENLINLRYGAPPPIPASFFLWLSQRVSDEKNDGLHKLLTTALPKLPSVHENTPLRAAFASHWTARWFELRKARPQLSRWVEAYAKALANHPNKQRLLSPWRGVWSDYRFRQRSYVDIEETLVEQLDSRVRMKHFLRIFLDHPRELTERKLQQLCLLSRYLEAPPGEVPNYAEALRCVEHTGKELFIWEDEIRRASRLSSSDPGAFGDMLRLSWPYDVEEPQEQGLWSIVAAFESKGLHAALLDGLRAGQLERLLRASSEVRWIRSSGTPVPDPGGPFGAATAPASPVSTDWHERYPAALRPELEAISRDCRAAERIAARVLGKAFRSRSDMEREWEHLRRIENPSDAQKKRTAALAARIQTPKDVDARQLERLRVKLQRSHRRTVVREWLEEVDRVYNEALAAQLGAERSPEWATDPATIRALIGVSELKAIHRSLALDILRTRLGAGPWDFMDRPANAAFVRSQTQRGLDMQAWLKPQPKIDETASGRKLHLSIERDPLELLQMGAVFNTCLSPDQCNYYSVFSNIADVNKQVLFARDTNGRVYGRMLIAMTDAGGLLAFHPYSHEPDGGFEELAREFVHELAERIGTTVVSRGLISKLVCREWYDDGPVDMAQRIEALEAGSPFRTSLAELPAEDFVSALKSALAPLRLDEHTLPLVFDLKELEHRPDLVGALAPHVRGRRLPTNSLLRWVKLLGDAACWGEPADRSALAEQLVAAFVATAREGYVYTDIMEALIAVHPQSALRFLREGKSLWNDVQGERLWFAGRASMKLQRRKKAINYFQRALPNLGGSQVERCRKDLEAARATCVSGLR